MKDINKKIKIKLLLSFLENVPFDGWSWETLYFSAVEIGIVKSKKISEIEKEIPQVMPPRICISLRPASFWFRPKTSKMRIQKHPDRKQDKYHVRRPSQLFLKFNQSTKSVKTAPVFHFTG